ncbi:MAG: ATP-binding protein [Trebonia sp.]|jgi:serine/threonine-protein kinase RsbW
MEIQMVLHLPRDAVSVPVSRQVLDSCLETLGVTPDTRDDIALALSEACANVIQHAGPGEEYEVRVSTGNYRCAIEVVNTGSQDGDPLTPDSIGASASQDSHGTGDAWPGRFAVADEPVSAMAEHGRGLQIIDAVVDNLQLTGDKRQGTTLHFDKKLAWLPGAPGQHLFDGDGGRLG